MGCATFRLYNSNCTVRLLYSSRIMATCFCLPQNKSNIAWDDWDCKDETVRPQKTNIYCICGAALHRVIRKDYVKKANSGPYMGLGYTVREHERSCDGCYSEFESDDTVHYCKSGHSYSHHLCEKCTLTKQSGMFIYTRMYCPCMHV